MISANVIKGVNELLDMEEIRLYPDEPYGDMVARTLNITSLQSEKLLASLHEGAPIARAAAVAGIDPATSENDVLVAIARAIGVTTGNLQRQ